MAYAPLPHIETNLGAPGTAVPNAGLVTAIASQLIAAGWEADVVAEVNSDTGYQYWRTSAPNVLHLRTTSDFDSFCLWSSPDACGGLASWSVHQAGSDLNVGIDGGCEPDGFSEFKNCCLQDGGDCGSCPSNTGTDCAGSCDCGSGCCTVTSTWGWSNSSGIAANHATLLAKVIENMDPPVGGTALIAQEIKCTGTVTTAVESWVAIWELGNECVPIVGITDWTLPNMGGAFNSTAEIIHGGWVMHSQESNTPENKLSVYFGVNSVTETFPFVQTFSTYTAGDHPLVYLQTFTVACTPVAPKAGAAHQTAMRNTEWDMRLIANPYQAIMYSHRGGTQTATNNTINHFGIGALRTVPINGEDPNDPDSWSFRRAIYHYGSEGLGLHQQNFVNPNGTSWWMVIDTGAGTSTSKTTQQNRELMVSGWNWNDKVKLGEPPCRWVSGEAFYCEPWAGFDAGTFTADRNSPILGQMWDAIMPSVTGNGTTSGSGQGGYFFWDGKWWLHWQDLRTTITSEGGPQGNLAFRVGFTDLTGAQPIFNGTCAAWSDLPNPRDVFLYAGNSADLWELPWGNVTSLSIDTGTFSGGTTTRTLTATCTEHPNALSDGDKLVAIHSERNYFTFTPEVIVIPDGNTTGTSVVTALSPGLGGATATIYADSITQASVSVTVND